MIDKQKNAEKNRLEESWGGRKRVRERGGGSGRKKYKGMGPVGGCLASTPSSQHELLLNVPTFRLLGPRSPLQKH